MEQDHLRWVPFRSSTQLQRADAKSHPTEQFKLLAGLAAPVDFQQLVIYKVCVS
jgi:hypothetical protein